MKSALKICFMEKRGEKTIAVEMFRYADPYGFGFT